MTLIMGAGLNKVSVPEQQNRPLLRVPHPARHNDVLNNAHKKTAISGDALLYSETLTPNAGFCQRTNRLAPRIHFVKSELFKRCWYGWQ